MSSIRLPSIDFSKQKYLKTAGTPEWESVKHQVRQALEEYGCFEATLEEVVLVQKALFGALQEFFDLPIQTKQSYVSDKLFRGYYESKKTLYESVIVDHAQIAENIEQRLTNILWPQGNTSFSKTLMSYTEIASGLEKTIKRMILESFGVEKYVDEVIDSTNYILRLMKYGCPQTSELTGAANAHFDQNMLTLLYQNEVNALELETKDGQWIKVNSSPNTFIVMIGESFSVWLNGRLSPTRHRVIMTGDKTRYCAGLFATPRGGYKVKAPEEFVDEQNPLLFKPFDYEEFLGYYSTEVARGKIGSGLKAYCTV